MDDIDIIFPRHCWFKDIKLVITPTSRTWKDKYSGKILAMYDYEIVNDFSSREFEYCFSLLSTQYVDPKFALSILNTPIDTSNEEIKVYFYIGLLEFVSNSKKIRTYRDLFNLIGSNFKNDLIYIKDKGFTEIIKGYPDALFLFIKYKDGAIYFGYDR